ncbi:MAG TPA: hydrogenase formation protein HypD, partial [Chroococcidiopsis sp.]
RAEFAAYDVRNKRLLSTLVPATSAPNDCISGQILQGIRKPQSCPAFGTRCTPDHPLGAPMVSSEGACAAYYRYRQQPVTAT